LSGNPSGDFDGATHLRLTGPREESLVAFTDDIDFAVGGQSQDLFEFEVDTDLLRVDALHLRN